MLSIARSTLAFPVQLTFLVINGFGAFLATVYNNNTPDLYPNNAHHKLGWMLIWTICAQLLLGLVNTCMRRNDSSRDVSEREAFIPISTENMAQHQRFHNISDNELHRFSNDSGHGTQQHSDTSRSQSIFSLGEDRTRNHSSPRRASEHELNEKTMNTMSQLNKFLIQNLPVLMTSQARYVLTVVYESINRLILILGFVALTTGIVTYGGIFRGSLIFSGLAHFIKGGVFFWYGVLTLGRWAGCFSEIGWVSCLIWSSSN